MSQGTNFSTGLRAIVAKLLALYFRLIPVPEKFVSSLDELKDCCVVTESQSVILEGLLLSFGQRIKRRFVHLLDSNQQGHNVVNWCALHDDQALQQILLKNDVKLLTLNIFSGRGPFRANPTYRLGFWELLGILLLGRFLIIFLGKPIDVLSLKLSNLLTLRRTLRIDFYKNLKLVRGTPFQTIQAQERVVLGGNEYQAEVSQLAEKLSMPRSVLIRKARRAFYEIAANPRAPMYRILAVVVGFMNNRLFSSIHCLGLDNLKQTVREKTVVLVPMHRSHLDYLLICSELYRAHFIPPLVAAGINLSFWPAGFLIRSVGAYFVKRNVGKDRLHALMLKRYVSYLVKRGHMQKFFIEGGRSRSGRMRLPKLGLLSILVDAYQKGYKTDISFVPVAVTYENVIEDSIFGQENTGRSKDRESLLSLFQAHRIFRKRYGEVVINFGEAISLVEFASQEQPAAVANDAQKISVGNFALHITRKIREKTNPGLTSLLHTAILMSPSYGLTRTQLVKTTQNLGRLIDITRQFNPSVGANTNSLKTFLEGSHFILKDLTRNGTIRSQRVLKDEVYYIPGERRFTADFYKNSTLHLFFESGLFSLLHQMSMNINRTNLEKLYGYFSYDFILKEKEAFLDECEKLISLLIKHEILETSDNITSYKSLEPGLYVPGILLPHLEALVWSADVLKSMAGDSDDDDRPAIYYSAAIERMLSEFRTAIYMGRMSRTEASSAAALNSALDTLQHLGAIYISNKQGKSKTIVIKDPTFEKLDLVVEALESRRRAQSGTELANP